MQKMRMNILLEFNIPTHLDASEIVISSDGVCMRPVGPLLASNCARPAAALRDQDFLQDFLKDFIKDLIERICLGGFA